MSQVMTILLSLNYWHTPDLKLELPKEVFGSALEARIDDILTSYAKLSIQHACSGDRPWLLLNYRERDESHRCWEHIPSGCSKYILCLFISYFVFYLYVTKNYRPKIFRVFRTNSDLIYPLHHCGCPVGAFQLHILYNYYKYYIYIAKFCYFFINMLCDLPSCVLYLYSERKI